MAAPPTPSSAMDADADADDADCLSTTQETAVERSVSRRPAEVPGKEGTQGRGRAPVRQRVKKKNKSVSRRDGGGEGNRYVMRYVFIEGQTEKEKERRRGRQGCGGIPATLSAWC